MKDLRTDFKKTSKTNFKRIKAS